MTATDQATLLATIDKMDATDDEKAAMKQQVRDGNANMRFTVYGWSKMQEGK